MCGGGDNSYPPYIFDDDDTVDPTTSTTAIYISPIPHSCPLNTRPTVNSFIDINDPSGT